MITETGVDGGVCDNCKCTICQGNQIYRENNCGWQKYTDAKKYLDELKWYDSLLKRDSYVIGATIFQAGIGGWSSFEISALKDDLTTYMKNLQPAS